MGFMSTLVVLHDQLHAIENDPDFGKKVADAIRRAGGGLEKGQRIDILGGAAQLVEMQHADVVSVIAVGGNHASILHREHNGGHHYTEEDRESLVKNLAQESGFAVTKKSARNSFNP